MQRLLKNSILAACLLVFSLTTATAATMYAVDTVSDELLAIDTTTGVGTIVGDTGFQNVQSLAFDSSGTLYGYDAVTRNLISLDTSTGAGTSIANIPTSGSNIISGMTFDPTGTSLFGIERTLGLNGNITADILVTIDTATGSLTEIGSLSGAAANNVVGLAFDSAGNLFGIDNVLDKLLSIDKTSGVTTEVTGTAFPSIAATSLAFDAGGNLFTVDTFPPDELWTINPATGSLISSVPLTFSGTGSTITGIEGIAFAPIPIPASAWLFGSGLLGLISILRRKKG